MTTNFHSKTRKFRVTAEARSAKGFSIKLAFCAAQSLSVYPVKPNKQRNPQQHASLSSTTANQKRNRKRRPAFEGTRHASGEKKQRENGSSQKGSRRNLVSLQK